MGEQLHTESPRVEPRSAQETSTTYIGRWNRLVSTTNWEKGRIICQWRAALIDAGADPAEHTDEAWSRTVGNVSPQHTGRLRRVFQQFGQTYQKYQGLYWSHFQAALDWHDAEMYLQGAVENDWSISQMRNQRWEATGALPEQEPRDEDIVTAEPDEDVDPQVEEPVPETIRESLGEVQDATETSDDESAPADEQTDSPPGYDQDELPPGAARIDPVRPFENLPELPPDLGEAFESMKLAVLHHKVAKWQQIARDDVLHVLDALKALVLAPAED